MKRERILEKHKLSGKVFVVLIMLAFVLLNMNTMNAWFRSDSEYYYQGICDSVEELKKGHISLSNFGIAGHMCYGYSIFVFIGQLLIPYHGIGIRLANLLLALVTIGVFWKVIGILFPRLEQWTRLFITAAFAFSPFMLGIFSEVHSDFPVLCFFVWLVYCYVSKRQIACLVTGFLLCFSKETGVLYYGTFFAGCFLYRLVKNENRNWLKKLVEEFDIIEWALLIPADLFLVCATTAKSWGGSAISPKLTDGQVNTFYLSTKYIWIKIKEIFLMNFAWLLIIPIVLFIVAVCRKKLQKTGVNTEWMIGLSVSGVVFLLFNFSYYTFTHYRYLQLYLFFYLILVVFLLEKSCQRVWIKRGVSLLLAISFLVESFVTIDPVTLAAFRNIDVGNGKIVTTNELVTTFKEDEHATFNNKAGGAELEKGELLDSVVYNREYLGFERVFEEAMADIGYDDKKAIIFPAIYEQDWWYTILAFFGTHDFGTLRWDEKSGDVITGDVGIQINWINMVNGIPVTVLEAEEVWYAKIWYRGEWYQENNLEYFDVLEERRYQSGKWKLAFERVKYRG